MRHPRFRCPLLGATRSIIAPGRSLRPQLLTQTGPGSGFVCPFCEGNEAETRPEVFAIRGRHSMPNGPGWKIRVVPNRYPALSSTFSGKGPASREGGFERDADGFHEVIVETPQHDCRFSGFALSHLESLLSVYRARIEELGGYPGVRSITLFRNDGQAAGASQEHPHAQILALPFVPKRLEAELSAARRHWLQSGSCPTCDLLKGEWSDGRRAVSQNDDFIVLTAFAPRFSYETWIVPKVHAHDFRLIGSAEIRRLASALAETLLDLEAHLGPFPYNLILQTAPTRGGRTSERSFHWRFEIVPRCTTPSGFELATDIFIVSTSPEEAATAIRTRALGNRVTGPNTARILPPVDGPRNPDKPC